jgi:hypothetical protein
MFESKLEKFKTDLVENIDTKVRALRDELSMDLSRESNRIDHILKTVQSMQSRLEKIESKPDLPSGNNIETYNTNNSTWHGNPLNDPDRCVVVAGLPVTEGEDLIQKAEDIIKCLGDQVSSNVLITGATRIRARYNNRPPLVKISFQNTEEKIMVLSNKMKLKDTENYKAVYIKSSKSHAERLIELNARTILRKLPGGCDLRVDANGRIRTRQQQQQHND